MKRREPDAETTAKEIERRRLRRKLWCSMCPPNRGENRTNRKPHGWQKPRSKNKRRVKGSA